VSNFSFSLTMDQVPSLPTICTWPDALRWMVCVMDPDDSRFAFIASCLSYSVKNDGLTDKQSAACEKILQRVYAEYNEGILICQNTIPKGEGESDDADGAQGRLN
jgi:hypothetical protein